MVANFRSNVIKESRNVVNVKLRSDGLGPTIDVPAIQCDSTREEGEESFLELETFAVPCTPLNR